MLLTYMLIFTFKNVSALDGLPILGRIFAVDGIVADIPAFAGMLSLLFLIFSLLLASLLPTVGVPSIVNVPAVAVVTASAFVLAAACVPAVAGVRAVVGALVLLASLLLMVSLFLEESLLLLVLLLTSLLLLACGLFCF